MGRQPEPIITHFSHHHPLHLTNPQPSLTCSCCKQTLTTEPLYSCRSPSCTAFSIHRRCSQLPPRITHPSHHHHPLSLIPNSQNPNGVFTCCGNNGDGFSYSCKDCGVNIHVACATLPLWLCHRSHCHQLKLVFLPPYGSNGFCCDVCGGIEGRRCWLYRCGSCGFDAHLSCATSKVEAVAGAGSGSDQGLNLLLNDINNQRNQVLLEAMMGGCGGGGGGGDVNYQLLQLMMGGGGMDNQMLQAIMGSGGGGGGGGGLDLSSFVGNVGDFGGFTGAGLMGGFGFL